MNDSDQFPDPVLKFFRPVIHTLPELANTMFESLQALPADALLRLIDEHKNDPRPEKVDLGVGVYKNTRGETPILDVVKQAEREILESQPSKAYLGTAGRAAFNTAMQTLVFGDAAADHRLLTVQTPGGSGALRLAADLIIRANKQVTLWVPDVTWSNHTPLLGGAGLQLKSYSYYDNEAHSFRFDAMLEALHDIPRHDIVLLHACCHNPTGVDPTDDQWRAIIDVLAQRGLIPMFDIAYQGFSKDIVSDAFSIRYAAQAVDELLVTSSCSKNFGLYRERTGALSVLAKDNATRKIVSSQVSMAARTLYSMPPDHGAAIVAKILTNDKLRQAWDSERDAMRDRISAMSSLLFDALSKAAPEANFEHLIRSKGMFCYLGINAEQVDQLKKDYGIYMADTSRINVAGITQNNVDYLASAIAAVM